MNCLIRMNLSLFTLKIFKKLAIEIFKVLNDENPQIVNEILRIRDKTSHELPQKSCCHIPSVNTVFSGTEGIDSSMRKHGNLYRMISNTLKIQGISKQQ